MMQWLYAMYGQLWTWSDYPHLCGAMYEQYISAPVLLSFIAYPLVVLRERSDTRSGGVTSSFSSMLSSDELDVSGERPLTARGG